MIKTLYYLGHFSDIAETFDDFVDRCVFIDNTKYKTIDFQPQDVLVFGGGTDVNPIYYDTKKSKRTSCYPDVDGSRDNIEWAYARDAATSDATMLGICRGSQFLAAFGGHKLYQDISGHCEEHYIKASDKVPEQFPNKSICISTHHQAVRKYKHAQYEMNVLYTSLTNRSHYAVITDDEIISTKEDPSYEEVEIYTIPKLKILGIQGHPEYASKYHPFTDLSRNLFQHYYQAWNK